MIRKPASVISTRLLLLLMVVVSAPVGYACEGAAGNTLTDELKKSKGLRDTFAKQAGLTWDEFPTVDKTMPARTARLISGKKEVVPLIAGAIALDCVIKFNEKLRKFLSLSPTRHCSNCDLPSDEDQVAKSIRDVTGHIARRVALERHAAIPDREAIIALGSPKRSHPRLWQRVSDPVQEAGMDKDLMEKLRALFESGPCDRPEPRPIQLVSLTLDGYEPGGEIRLKGRHTIAFIAGNPQAAWHVYQELNGQFTVIRAKVRQSLEAHKTPLVVQVRDDSAGTLHVLTFKYQPDDGSIEKVCHALNAAELLDTGEKNRKAIRTAQRGIPCPGPR